LPRQDRLPPMQAMSMFESAARLASFTAAARELGSTQPAVSQRVVQLEETLGAALFERGHRGVTLTEDGVRLFEAVRQSLDTIRVATSDIRARHAAPAQRSLKLLTDFGFATHGLAAPPAHRGITFNSYGFVAHAAIMGQGVALGWAPLVDELVASGQLIELFDIPVTTDSGYLLSAPRVQTAAVGAFRDWLLADCGVVA